MAHIAPLPREELLELEDAIVRAESRNGFVPNVILTLGRRPEIQRAFSQFSRTILGEGEVDPLLKLMVSHVVSRSAECIYTQAHTAEAAANAGVPIEKVEALHEFETNPLFSDAECAALRLARDAGCVPNRVTDAHFEELRRYYSEPQIVELLCVASVFTFFNRFHSSNATELEAVPLEFATKYLSAGGWHPGKHAPATDA